MENMSFTMDLGFAPECLFETELKAFEDGPTTLYHDYHSSGEESLNTQSLMEFNLDLSSDSMTSFFELEQIPEVKPEKAPEVKITPQSRPSVIISKPLSLEKVKKPLLTNIMSDCGLLEDFKEETSASIASPTSIHSDMEMEKNQELIDELEEFFIKVDGQPTIVDEESVAEPISVPVVTHAPEADTILSALTSGNIVEAFTTTTTTSTLSLEDLNSAYTTSLVSEDGQNVIIIVAPSSPSGGFDSVFEPVSPEPEFLAPKSSPKSMDSDDPDWSPSPSPPSIHSSYSQAPIQTKQRKKYARSRPPQPPKGPYPIEKKERKKAQNRTAAFRYREKKKSEQEMIDDELELLSAKNVVLKDKLTEMETEFRYLKKLMTEAGLGRYAQTVQI